MPRKLPPLPIPPVASNGWDGQPEMLASLLARNTALSEDVLAAKPNDGVAVLNPQLESAPRGEGDTMPTLFYVWDVEYPDEGSTVEVAGTAEEAFDQGRRWLGVSDAEIDDGYEIGVEPVRPGVGWAGSCSICGSHDVVAIMGPPAGDAVALCEQHADTGAAEGWTVLTEERFTLVPESAPEAQE